MPAFMHYEQTELNAQYNLRAAFPDAAAIIASWVERSEKARARLPHDRDVSYGPHPRQQLDVFHAAKPGGSVLIFFHGGYWRALDKNTVSFVAEAFVARGVTVVVPSYPLAPASSLTEIVAATHAVLDWVTSPAGLGADSRNIVVMGNSAGAHLAAMLCASTARVLAGCIGISGAYDLAGVQASYMNADLRITDREVVSLSPTRLPPAPMPLLVSVGGLETAEFQRMQSDFVARRTAAFPTTVVAAEGLHHFDILAACVNPGAAQFEAIWWWYTSKVSTA